ncbi:hypothetical protein METBISCDRAFT_21170 [Metschnikowia bicuspidata]|uniref:Uncharacterized protein n=1 Tax=Metschnikowia bicuspidata TaxID=27322 RepID=A0A4V1J3Q8_9ASCO|nr:hypothetical protein METBISCDRAFT_21170 [Metschnikowia bicuspidata]
MQGSYKNKGLPRPYYMKPHKRGMYESMVRASYFTNSRKLMGYVMLLFFFGLFTYMIGQELRAVPQAAYEIVPKSALGTGGKDGDVKNFVQSGKNKEEVPENDALLKSSKASLLLFDNVVSEAPKGGLVNEAPIVGNDAGLFIDGKKSSGDAAIKTTGGMKGVKIANKSKKGPFSTPRDEDDEDNSAASPAKNQKMANNGKDEGTKAKVIKNNKALDSQHEESKKMEPDAEKAQNIIDESEE